MIKATSGHGGRNIAKSDNCQGFAKKHSNASITFESEFCYNILWFAWQSNSSGHSPTCVLSPASSRTVGF